MTLKPKKVIQTNHKQRETLSKEHELKGVTI
jgi:hypothetical protein